MVACVVCVWAFSAAQFVFEHFHGFGASGRRFGGGLRALAVPGLSGRAQQFCPSTHVQSAETGRDLLLQHGQNPTAVVAHLGSARRTFQHGTLTGRSALDLSLASNCFVRMAPVAFLYKQTLLFCDLT